MKELNSVVTNVQQISENMRILRIAPIGWELPDFEPGQYITLSLPSDFPRASFSSEEYKPSEPGKLIKRAYSIASSSKQKEYLEFYISIVRSGSLSPRLFSLKIGDQILMSKKGVGIFTLDQVPVEKNIVLVSTGTGLAPYMSMLRAGALETDRKIMVIHGASYSWDLGYYSELSLLDNLASNFKYIPTVTRSREEPINWKGDTRRVQHLLQDDTIDKVWGFKPTPENTHFFLCGNPEMVNQVITLLEERGFKEHARREPGQIHCEKFE